jgi:hypothetical protein
VTLSAVNVEADDPTALAQFRIAALGGTVDTCRVMSDVVRA